MLEINKLRLEWKWFFSLQITVTPQNLSTSLINSISCQSFWFINIKISRLEWKDFWSCKTISWSKSFQLIRCLTIDILIKYLSGRNQLLRFILIISCLAICVSSSISSFYILCTFWNRKHESHYECSWWGKLVTCRSLLQFYWRTCTYTWITIFKHYITCIC